MKKENGYLNVLGIKISWLRIIFQVISAFCLLYLGFVGVKMFTIGEYSLTLPTLSCHYVDNRILNCFLYTLQCYIPEGWKTYYKDILISGGMFLVMMIIGGRSWCGWVCPLGFLQDVFIYIRKAAKLAYLKFSTGWITGIKIIKYSLLILVILIIVSIGIPGFFMGVYRYDLDLAFCQICPGKKLLSSITGNFGYLFFIDDISMLARIMSIVALAVGVIYIFGAAIIRRFWCRICPLGCLMGFLNKISLFSLKKDGSRCTKCGICTRACPVQIKEVYEQKDRENVTVGECILCLKCVELCPEDKCLKAEFCRLPLVVSTHKMFSIANPLSKKTTKHYHGSAG